MDLRGIAVAVALAAALSGCVDDEPATPGPGLDEESWQDVGARLFDRDHEHTLRELHTEVARGVEVLAASTLTGDGRSAGWYTEADVQGDLIAVTVVTGEAHVDLTTFLLDRKALPAIEVLGSFDEPGAYGDVKLDHQHKWAYVAYPGLRFSGLTSGVSFSIWDVSDPAAPQRLGQAFGAGCHMLNTMVLGGESYVWCVTVTGAAAYRIVETPAGVLAVPVEPGTPQSDPEVLRYLDYYSALTPLGPAILFAAHDMTAQLDSLTQDPVVVSAHELQGIRIFDVSIPEAAVEIGHWKGDGLDKPMERIHTVGMTEIDGRRIVFAATETYWNADPALYVIDFTDYAAPRLIMEWNPPGIEDDANGIYSTHNFQIVGSQVYLANFHAGTWALDFSQPEAPVTRGLRTPVRDTGYPHPDDVSVNHNWIWDVLVVDGYAIHTDAPAGIEVLLFDGDPAGDAEYTGFM